MTLIMHKSKSQTYNMYGTKEDSVLTAATTTLNHARTSIFSPALRKTDDDGVVLGSEILKSLHFALNPQIHYRKKKQKEVQAVVMDKLKSQVAEISLSGKSLEKMKQKRKLAESFDSGLPVTKAKLKQSRSVVRGTMAIMMNAGGDSGLPSLKKPNGDLSKTQELTLEGITEQTGDKFRLEIVNWLNRTKKAVVNKINENQQVIIAWTVYLNYVNRNEFEELLLALGFTYDREVYEKLFRLFDVNDNGVIDQKEVLSTLELLNENNFEAKLKMFFDMADDEDNEEITEENLVKFLRKNLTSEDEIKKVRPAVKSLLYKELNLPPKSTLTRRDLEKACEDIEALRSVIEANVTYLKTVSKSRAKPAGSKLQTSQLELGQGAYSLPYMQRIVKAFEEKEKIAGKYGTYKQETNKGFKYIKDASKTHGQNLGFF